MRTAFLLISILALTIGAHAQKKIGQDIEGESGGDNSGISVSMPDANTVAVGAKYNSGNGLWSGQVRIYTLNDSEWIQKGEAINGEAEKDFSGQSVSMPDANTVAVGAPHNNGNGIKAGQVRIYTWNGSAWVQKGGDIDGKFAGEKIGMTVSMPDINTVAVGTPHNETVNGNYSGLVRIYKWSGSAWVQKGSDIKGKADYDQSGQSISMPDANTVAIGAPGDDGNGNNSGQVRVYNWSGSTWVQKGADIDGEAEFDESGMSVSMPDANTVAVGAPGNNGNGIKRGHVRIYSWSGSAWVQKGVDIDGEADHNNSGSAISMPDANTVAVKVKKIYGMNAGYVHIFEWNGSAWIQKGNDMDGEISYDWASSSVSMPDTITVAIGDPNNYNGHGVIAGRVRIYLLCNTAGTDVITACDSYTWINGITYTASNNTATYILPNAAGCDSVVTLNLTIPTIDISVTNTSSTLTASAADAEYQWLDCNNNMAVIPGAVNRSFTASTNGSYAVEVTQNSCTDTSACIVVNNIGISENNFGSLPVIYPNPCSGALTVDLPFVCSEIEIIVRNYMGQEINRQTFLNSDKPEIKVDGPAGIYFIDLNAGNKRALLKVIKE